MQQCVFETKTCDIYDLQKWDGWGMVEVGTA